MQNSFPRMYYPLQWDSTLEFKSYMSTKDNPSLSTGDHLHLLGIGQTKEASLPPAT